MVKLVVLIQSHSGVELHCMLERSPITLTKEVSQ